MSTQSLYNCCSCGMSTMWMLYFSKKWAGGGGMCVCCIMCHLKWKQFFCRFSVWIWKPYGVRERHRAAALVCSVTSSARNAQMGLVVQTRSCSCWCRDFTCRRGEHREGRREKWALGEEPEKCRRWLPAKIQKCVSDMCYLHRRAARASKAHSKTLHGC